MKRALRILVPIDFSSYSWQTLHFALSLQDMLEPVLVLLHVLPVADYSELGLSIGMDQSPPERDVLQHLQREAVSHLPAVNAPKVLYRVGHGVPFTEICRFAEEEKVDLIVIGTHGRTGLSHLLIGSTAERVVRHASCPVLSIKPKLL
ncbi:universal stress protein [Geothermobacter hydrogeniphilus]|uniref:universal stress protein n=1 Tax=Geothermobacter hydrogeniphilus TaxID=1969733 RepID=UPI00111C54A9|nr:universal stress protein [Geothermobacter hydrogeniphilus]